MGYLTYEDGSSGRIRVVNPQYLPYVTYQDMGGTLDETTFDEYEYEAETVVNWYTFDRLKKEQPENYPEALQRCMYQLIKIIVNKMQAMSLPTVENAGSTAAIVSQSNDGVSASYNVMSAKDVVQSADAEMQRCIQRYLQGVTNSLGHKLLYRGVYPNE